MKLSMEIIRNPRTPTKTAIFFYKLCLIFYLFGFPNFWSENFNLSNTFVKTFNFITKALNFFVYLFIIMELGAFFTQDKLSEKQKSDLLLFGIAHPILWGYVVITMNQNNEVRNLFCNILELQKVYNDRNVELRMIRKSTAYSIGLIMFTASAMIAYTVDALLQVFKKDGTFTITVTAWPDVTTKSASADIARAGNYILWWILMIRVFAVFILVVCLNICMTYQYKNLQSYFYKLIDIFDKNDLNQREKEFQYEEALKVGIKLHSDTLRCIIKSNAICRGAFSGHIIFNIIAVIIFMFQIANSDRSMAKTFTAAVSACAVLISTGFFMWNAGDITIEASHLTTAMYFSGWQNCRKQSSARIRKLIVLAMSQAQKPVILKCLGIIAISYQSYVSIVKSSYSIFSVLY